MTLQDRRKSEREGDGGRLIDMISPILRIPHSLYCDGGDDGDSDS